MCGYKHLASGQTDKEAWVNVLAHHEVLSIEGKGPPKRRQESPFSEVNLPLISLEV
jgi:hypothetical protein